MVEASIKPRARQRSSGWVYFGLVATGIYFAAILVTLSDADVDRLLQIKSFDFPSLNTFGDFLAGLCAPLAFLWLFVATMVQSQELALQSEELRLTREEFRLNREVSTRQAEEARSQAQYIGQQTAMLQAAEVDRLIEVHRDAFLRKMSEADGSQVKFGEGTDTAVISFGASPPKDFRAASKQLQRAAGELRGLVTRSPDRPRQGNLSAFIQIRHTLNSIEANINAASLPVQAAMQRDELAEATLAIDYLIEQTDPSTRLTSS
ncbi:hypothetical protein [Mesorhizobium sp. J8]|uniref:hypothetical protein n=1 Tax=Mesorhizobium sp. J8 TaxID=2777475 RepID=UPI001915B793|nr:hypothetical protein [Mesorhizobium sp. J8]BCM19179.1 hypothetical protein MJ8_29510 [Mesorhizobium sp. J8]